MIRLLKGGLLLLFGTLGVAALLLAVLAWSSRRAAEVGLSEGQLRRCPETPNCIGSERQDAAHAVPALDVGPLEPFAAWNVFRRAVEATGGKIAHVDGNYLHAEYHTSLLGFVDDFEARLDESRGRIEVRSASRVGRSDLGVNRRRLQRLRAVYQRLRNGSLTRAQA